MTGSHEVRGSIPLGSTKQHLMIKNRVFREQRVKLLSMIRSALSGAIPDSASRG
jgi:hypothetical protein